MISRVETISYMESVLLGDPFHFINSSWSRQGCIKFLTEIMGKKIEIKKSGLGRISSCRELYIPLGPGSPASPRSPASRSVARSAIASIFQGFLSENLKKNEISFWFPSPDKIRQLRYLASEVMLHLDNWVVCSKFGHPAQTSDIYLSS